jgi:hypothetical protein
MHIPHLTQLAEWLEAGAPHAYFNMELGICAATDDGVADATGDCSTLGSLLRRTDEMLKPDCGTVCCIAGAAHLMSVAEPGEIFPSLKRQQALLKDTEGDWAATRDAALGFLGLSRNLHESEMAVHKGHPLFDAVLAPDPCSPAQAAAAVRRVIAGKAPWKTTRSQRLS